MDVEKTIEFILDQQAKCFAALLEMQNETRQELKEVRSLVAEIARQQLELTHHVDDFQRGMSAAMLAIAEQQRLLTEEHKLFAEEQRRLAETQRHTEERLNALITVVDGMVRRPPQQ